MTGQTTAHAQMKMTRHVRRLKMASLKGVGANLQQTLKSQQHLRASKDEDPLHASGDA